MGVPEISSLCVLDSVDCFELNTDGVDAPPLPNSGTDEGLVNPPNGKGFGSVDFGLWTNPADKSMFFGSP